MPEAFQHSNTMGKYVKLPMLSPLVEVLLVQAHHTKSGYRKFSLVNASMEEIEHSCLKNPFPCVRCSILLMHAQVCAREAQDRRPGRQDEAAIRVAMCGAKAAAIAAKAAATAAAAMART